MAFKPPPPLLEKVLRFKALEHKEGRFFLWGTPCVILPMASSAFLFKLIEEAYGSEVVKNSLYYTGKFQAIRGVQIINKRFGYAETLQDERKILEFNTQQLELLGLGSWKWRKMGFGQDNVFILYGKSPFAEIYKRFFGWRKEAVDYYMAGIIAGGLESITGKKFNCIEQGCIVKGGAYCELTAKPSTDWKRGEFKKFDAYEKLEKKISIALSIKADI